MILTILKDLNPKISENDYIFSDSIDLVNFCFSEHSLFGKFDIFTITFTSILFSLDTNKESDLSNQLKSIFSKEEMNMMKECLNEITILSDQDDFEETDKENSENIFNEINDGINSKENETDWICEEESSYDNNSNYYCSNLLTESIRSNLNEENSQSSVYDFKEKNLDLKEKNNKNCELNYCSSNSKSFKESFDFNESDFELKSIKYFNKSNELKNFNILDYNLNCFRINLLHKTEFNIISSFSKNKINENFNFVNIHENKNLLGHKKFRSEKKNYEQNFNFKDDYSTEEESPFQIRDNENLKI